MEYLTNSQWKRMNFPRSNISTMTMMFNIHINSYIETLAYSVMVIVLGIGCLGWLFGFYDISTFIGYLLPNPFLYILTVLFQTVQFSISIVFFITFVCFFVFYGISKFVGYFMPNPFLYKKSVLFQTIQFSMSTQFNRQKHFYFKLFSLVKQFLFNQFILVLVKILFTHS